MKRKIIITAEAVQKYPKQYQELRLILEEILASAIHNLTVQFLEFDITTNWNVVNMADTLQKAQVSG